MIHLDYNPYNNHLGIQNGVLAVMNGSEAATYSFDYNLYKSFSYPSQDELNGRLKELEKFSTACLATILKDPEINIQKFTVHVLRQIGLSTIGWRLFDCKRDPMIIYFNKEFREVEDKIRAYSKIYLNLYFELNGLGVTKENQELILKAFQEQGAREICFTELKQRLKPFLSEENIGLKNYLEMKITEIEKFAPIRFEGRLNRFPKYDSNIFQKCYDFCFLLNEIASFFPEKEQSSSIPLITEEALFNKLNLLMELSEYVAKCGLEDVKIWAKQDSSQFFEILTAEQDSHVFKTFFTLPTAYHYLVNLDSCYGPNAEKIRKNGQWKDLFFQEGSLHNTWREKYAAFGIEVRKLVGLSPDATDEEVLKKFEEQDNRFAKWIKTHRKGEEFPVNPSTKPT